MSTSALILAAGAFTRMNGINKQLFAIDGIPVIVRTSLNFQNCPDISEIVIAARECDIEEISALCEKYGITKLKAVVPGGSTRAVSAALAFREVGDVDFVAVQDGARPFASPELISRVIEKARITGAAIAAIPVKDTIKLAENGRIASTPDRASLFAAQTPQVFSRGLYERMCENGDPLVTDDSTLAERLGAEVLIAEGSVANIKITGPEDLPADKENAMIRIGHGYDVHRLVPDRKLILGGVDIPYELGLLGHSDADVLVHAIMDALLGALALGDIGKHFPDSDPQYKGADSMELLRRVAALIKEQGFAPSNLDATVIAERPKLAPYIPQMRNNIARVLEIPTGAVSVKATTEEGLGIGGDGIAAHCVCVVVQNR